MHRADFLFRLARPQIVFKEPITALFTPSIFSYSGIVQFLHKKTTSKVFEQLPLTFY